MAEGGVSLEISLEYTPTWIVAIVCTVIVSISLIFEWFLHVLNEFLKKNMRLLVDALQKLKEEHFSVDFNHGAKRRLLAAGSSYCTNKGKVPVLSIEAIHQLHTFIFVLAMTHAILTAITILLGILQMNKWRNWEKSIEENAEKVESTHNSAPQIIADVQAAGFIQQNYTGFSKLDDAKGWLRALFKQFWGSVNKEEYTALRRGFIKKHCGNNEKFKFFDFMMRALQVDFKKVVGISWYLWAFVMIFLVLNVAGWHAYFVISIIPLALLILVGAKLEHVIIEMAYAVASRHTVLVVEHGIALDPSDKLFWFNKPKVIFFFLHFILFESAFQIAYFFWILTMYGIDSCIMERKGFLIPRFIVSVIIVALCSYSTIPLYAIISRMSEKFDILIFEETARTSVLRWINDSKHAGTGENGRSNVACVTGEHPVSRGVDGTGEASSIAKWPTTGEIQLTVAP
ncbi:hypothetical protein LUZ60_004399 [Juncus effusus]|nr:hypothetical protein LUZ60_004399 [Juncus effusus]